MSWLSNIIRRLLGSDRPRAELYARKSAISLPVEEIHSIWDYLKFRENSQAFHLTSVLGFEEWVSMEEIKRRVLAVFGIRYKNDRSLYPYAKTLVDCGLLETIDVGGARQWRKKDLVIKIKVSAKDRETERDTKKAVAKEKEKVAARQ